MNILEESLNEIYNNFQQLNNQINKKNISLENLEHVINSLNKYDNQLKNIYNMINSINHIKDHLKILYNNKIINLSSEQLSEDKTNYDHSIDLVNITNNDKYKTKKYCKCPVIIITEDAVPDIINTPIYLIKETNEYCIKINNKLIKGNIGNIANNKKNKKIKKCNRMYCNNKYYSQQECKFYHEGIDIRNFPSYSWTPILKNKLGKSQNYNNNLITKCYDLENTRFLGSLDTLLEDLALTNEYEKKLRNKQLMHDLLLYQILDQYLE